MSRTKKTGKEWGEILGVNILQPTGWVSEKQFLSELVTKIEFLNRAAVSIVEKRDVSRRAVAKILKDI